MLNVVDVSKSYPGAQGPVPVLAGVCLALAPGRSLALTGESGSGKSTLLHLIAGLDAVDAGRITVAGAESPASATRAAPGSAAAPSAWCSSSST